MTLYNNSQRNFCKTSRRICWKNFEMVISERVFKDNAREIKKIAVGLFEGFAEEIHEKCKKCIWRKFQRYFKGITKIDVEFFK